MYTQTVGLEKSAVIYKAFLRERFLCKT